MTQVVGVSKQQFRQWLHNSVMASAEDMYLKPLMKSDRLQFVIIKNVTVLANGKNANIGLIATTRHFISGIHAWLPLLAWWLINSYLCASDR